MFGGGDSTPPLLHPLKSKLYNFVFYLRRRLTGVPTAPSRFSFWFDKCYSVNVCCGILFDVPGM
jgi:hypothetical protein